MPHTSTAPRRVAALLLCLTLLALAAAGASSATSAAGDPSLTAMALAASDFVPGATVTRQHYTKPDKPATSRYVRVFRAGTRLGSKELLFLESDVSLFADAGAAAADVKSSARDLRTAQARRQAAQAFAKEFARSGHLKLKRSAASALSSIGAGQSSVHFAITMVLKNGATLVFHFVEIQTDRAAVVMLVMPMPGEKLTRAELTLLGQAQQKHLRDAFTVTNVAAPAITGAAAQAQILNASNGDWGGSPSSYAYQWSRCDATGTTCADIPGATASTYAVAPADTGSTLRASVTAQNSVTSLAATSVVTALVA